MNRVIKEVGKRELYSDEEVAPGLIFKRCCGGNRNCSKKILKNKCASDFRFVFDPRSFSFINQNSELMENLKDGDFVVAGRVAAPMIARTKREIHPEGLIFCEWTDPESGDIQWDWFEAGELKPYGVGDEDGATSN